jgi:hypothetical protein
MANTQRDGRNGRADAGCGPPDGRRRSRVSTGCRGGWTAPASDGMSLQRPRLVRVEVLAASAGAADLDSGLLPRIKPGDPRAGRSRTDRIESSTVHRLKAIKSNWQISGKRRLKALGPSTGRLQDPA